MSYQRKRTQSAHSVRRVRFLGIEEEGSTPNRNQERRVAGDGPFQLREGEIPVLPLPLPTYLRALSKLDTPCLT
jgi:hypothetical protein